MRLSRLLLAALCACPLFAFDSVVVRPQEIDNVLVNPGIGFTTFQRFNGDSLNEGVKWTEGFPIQYQPFHGNLEVKGQPLTTIAYFRVYWRFLEPEKEKFRWDLVDTALKTAHQRGQKLMLRVAPYGTSEKEDVPGWYRAMLGKEPDLPRKWMTNPEDPRYVQYFGGFIREFGKRYDGNPDIELVDISIVGAWGEAAGTDLLKKDTKDALLAAYFETFRTTPLVIQMEDKNEYAARFNVGVRFDCLGDLGHPEWGRGYPGWCHMYDYYPEALVRTGLQGAWQTAPVSLEACWVMQEWKNRGWSLDYIIDQSLKWHISSFNNKSSAVPEEWRPKVDQWLKKMGYRFVLRKLVYPKAVSPMGKLGFQTWWENKGVAPIYHPYTFAIRLKGPRTLVLPTNADVRKWLPGDAVYDDAVFLPADLPEGEYEVSVALLDPNTQQPKVKLAIAGIDSEGWYKMGKIDVREKAGDWTGAPSTAP